MITVASFSKPEEAHLLRMRLEAGGVPAYIQNENLVQVDWLYSNAIGGVRVQIADDDLEDARSILDAPVFIDELTETAQCPNCSSTDVFEYNLYRRLSFLSVLLLWFPLPVGKDTNKCGECGHKWR